MQLEVHIEGRVRTVEVDAADLEAARTLFERMDRDMDKGWKMGPEFIENPGVVERGQIAAARLLLAVEGGNESMAQAMAGYILTRLPSVRTVIIDSGGEPLNTEFRDAAGAPIG